jgi:hypothetical protein
VLIALLSNPSRRRVGNFFKDRNGEGEIISRSQSLIATTATTQSSSTLKGIMIMKIITIVTAVTAGLVAMLSVAAAARRAPRKGPAIMPRR